MTRRLSPTSGKWTASFLLLVFCSRAIVVSQSADQFQSGLAVTFTSDDGRSSDVAVLPNVWLFVQNGKPPTSFVTGGRFTAVWTGFLQLDLRSEYAFQAELNGDVKLEINGKLVFKTEGTGIDSVPSESVRLNKGSNSVIVTYHSPSTGDPRLRLLWIPKGTVPGPLPSTALFHQPNEAEVQANKLRLGRELFLEYRCAKCHVGPSPKAGTPELAMDAPAFESMGSRRNFEWMAKWILDPKSQRNGVYMPQVLHGATARADAEAAAAFLMSSKHSGSSPSKESDADKEAGHKLFDSLHCVACHNAPDSTELDAKKISLGHVAQKFGAGALASFLKKPEAYYHWIQMPNFKLTDDEASQLTAYLVKSAKKVNHSRAPDDKAVLERGQKIIQASGCLNCHTAELENQFQAKSLAGLDATKWHAGCLAESRPPNAKAPAFGFTVEERAALQEFGSLGRSSLSRNVPAEFAERQTRLLNCTECHGKLEGLPHLDILGGKLKPEWASAFIGGEVIYKPRPWLEARMPAFTSRAALLAQGLAAQHGYPPQTASEPSIDETAAKVGQKLVSADGGFACIACHAIAMVKATQVFESAGVNLAYSEVRLLRPYYERWLRNPLAIDSSTKMPAYFDEEGKSPLINYYDGSGSKQINAIWHYLRLGEKMPPPPGTESSP